MIKPESKGGYAALEVDDIKGAYELYYCSEHLGISSKIKCNVGQLLIDFLNIDRERMKDVLQEIGDKADELEGLDVYEDEFGDTFVGPSRRPDLPLMETFLDFTRERLESNFPSESEIWRMFFIDIEKQARDLNKDNPKTFRAPVIAGNTSAYSYSSHYCSCQSLAEHIINYYWYYIFKKEKYTPEAIKPQKGDTERITEIRAMHAKRLRCRFDSGMNFFFQISTDHQYTQERLLGLHNYTDTKDRSLDPYLPMTIFWNKENQSFFNFFVIDTLKNLIEADLYQVITRLKTIKKCYNCHRYFIAYRENMVYCRDVSPLPQDKGKLCSEVGKSKKFLDNNVSKQIKRIRGNMATRISREKKRGTESSQSLLTTLEDNRRRFNRAVKILRQYEKRGIVTNEIIEMFFTDNGWEREEWLSLLTETELKT